MKKVLSFDDILMIPRFSEIKSRKDVDLSQVLFDTEISNPFISSNMDTVTGARMADAMWQAGAIGSLHRFMPIEDNVNEFDKVAGACIVSVGLGTTELERAVALYEAGAQIFLIDVAHGSSMEVVKQYDALRRQMAETHIIVGNFATAESIKAFKHHTCSKYKPDAYKIGIGGGSACLTRVVTGFGLPTFASIQDCATSGEVIIADGGIRNSGDAAKALAAGADLLMIGRLFAGAEESPSSRAGDTKKYRGSASAESYEVQGKTASHRAPEGDSYTVPYTGPVKNTVDMLAAGIRSACSYAGANNLNEFRELVDFVEVTQGGANESKAHGRS